MRIRKFTANFFVFLLLFNLSYIVLFPFLAKLSSALMSKTDLYDSAVALIPKKATLDNFKYFLNENRFLLSFLNTSLYSTLTAVFSTASATLVGYGMARYHFKTVNLWLVLLIATMLIPGLTLAVPLYTTFRFFDIGGIFRLITGNPLTLTGTVFPIAILSATCLGFKGGIHAILMRQYFKGVPQELSEASFIDGAGHLKTFLTVMLPMARAMMTVVFILSFSWQWVDTYYSGLLSGGKPLLTNLVLLMLLSYSQSVTYADIVLANAGALITIFPLIVIYLFFQRKIVEGIERAGLTG